VLGWVGRTLGLRRYGPLELEFGQVQQVDERFDDPNGVVLVDVVVNALRQQENLASMQALDIARDDRESVGARPRRLAQHRRLEYPRGGVFTQPLSVADGVLVDWRFVRLLLFRTIHDVALNDGLRAGWARGEPDSGGHRLPDDQASGSARPRL